MERIKDILRKGVGTVSLAALTYFSAFSQNDLEGFQDKEIPKIGLDQDDWGKIGGGLSFLQKGRLQDFYGDELPFFEMQYKRKMGRGNNLNALMGVGMAGTEDEDYKYSLTKIDFGAGIDKNIFKFNNGRGIFYLKAGSIYHTFVESEQSKKRGLLWMFPKHVKSKRFGRIGYYGGAGFEFETKALGIVYSEFVIENFDDLNSGYGVSRFTLGFGI